MILLGIYVALLMVSMLVVGWFQRRVTSHDLTSLKTVTFGDESAVYSNRIASVISILAIFLIWAAFTGSRLTPIHVPGPFVGEVTFNYSAVNTAGFQDDGVVKINVYGLGANSDIPVIEPGNGFAKNYSAAVAARRSVLLKLNANDEAGSTSGTRVVSIDGKSIELGKTVELESGKIIQTDSNSLLFEPNGGLQMDPIWLPSPESVAMRFVNIYQNGYQNSSLWQHVSASVIRVLAGFLVGSIVGIPLGYAMGLSSWFRGWFDPIVEFMRPVPPLALIPLIIIWFGIGEVGKVVLLFLAALWIMVIAARAGVAGVRISKIHAAYSLGASKWQILYHVIIP
ncbi:MAG: ABC transporter permease, partial [Kiritimatiellae bacterium]|nr:ABC transporter permease [Kiritimatiellia bacterium]